MKIRWKRRQETKERRKRKSKRREERERKSEKRDKRDEARGVKENGRTREANVVRVMCDREVVDNDEKRRAASGTRGARGRGEEEGTTSDR